jgi:hypothetical protein
VAAALAVMVLVTGVPPGVAGISPHFFSFHF